MKKSIENLIHTALPRKCVEQAVWEGNDLLCPVCRRPVAFRYHMLERDDCCAWTMVSKVYIYQGFRRYRQQILALCPPQPAPSSPAPAAPANLCY